MFTSTEVEPLPLPLPLDPPDREAWLVAIFGFPTMVSVWDAASTRIICWRSFSSRVAEWLGRIAGQEGAAGSAPLRALCISTTTPPATATSAVIVVTRRKLSRLRPRRLTGARLRCCDNAVLPSAKRTGTDCPGAQTAAVQ